MGTKQNSKHIKHVRSMINTFILIKDFIKIDVYKILKEYLSNFTRIYQYFRV